MEETPHSKRKHIYPKTNLTDLVSFLHKTIKKELYGLIFLQKQMITLHY